MIIKLLLTFIAMLWQSEAVHFTGAAPALKRPIKARKGVFRLYCLSELPGYREVLGVPVNVNTAQAFLLPEVHFTGGHTMQKSDKIQKPKRENEVSKIISETNQLINKIKHDYHIAEMLASSALHAIKGMSGEVDIVTQQLSMLTAAREDVSIKILPFKGEISATGRHEKQG